MNRATPFLNIKINKLTKEEIIDTILNLAKYGKSKTAFYLNAHCVNIAFQDAEYLSILNKSDLVYAGGQGVVWAARFLGIDLPERVNILDFFDRLSDRLINEEITIYLLGNTKYIVQKTQDAFKRKGLKVIGSRDGFFDREEEKNIIKRINALKPDILMVGMGVPKQEKWIFNHLRELDVNLCWAVGAAFDWLSGERRRAPEWMIRNGLEWLHRLWQQPWRLWRRYLIGNFVFIWHILRYKLK